MLLLYELHLSPAICTCAGLFCLLQSRHGYSEFQRMRSNRQGQINVSGFFWLSLIKAASSFWRLCSLVQQLTQRRQQGESLLSHLICTMVLVPTFTLNWQLRRYEQGRTLFCLHHLQLLLLFSSVSHRDRELQFNVRLMLLIRFFCSSLPSAALLPHLISACPPHSPQPLPDWICWSSCFMYLSFSSADGYSNHWYLQSSGRYK